MVKSLGDNISGGDEPTREESDLAREIIHIYGEKGWTMAYRLARRLLDAGYQKVPEQATVPPIEELLKSASPEARKKIEDHIDAVGKVTGVDLSSKELGSLFLKGRPRRHGR